MWYCTDEECEHNKQLHAHQGNDAKKIDIKPLARVIREVFGRDSFSLALLDDGEDLIYDMETLVDERGTPGFTSGEFNCGDEACAWHPLHHFHIYNIDPARPGLPIWPGVHQSMIEQGLEYKDKSCIYSKQGHIHYEKEEGPTIHIIDDESTVVGQEEEVIEVPIDERGDRAYVAEDFGCLEIGCEPPHDNQYHIRNFDPEFPAYGI